jgi:hypothetical protein
MKAVKPYAWPYAIFHSSRTPPGLYARQKWLNQASSPLWRADFDLTVANLVRGQSADGLWAGSSIETIRRLFGLHLTVRTSNPTIERSLDALLNRVSAANWAERSTALPRRRLRGLPFAPGSRQSVILSATLFLSVIFGRASDSTVLEMYDRIAADLIAMPLDHKDPAALHNIFRALVVHPDYTTHASTGLLVAWLAVRQSSHGDWGPDIPFYQALNALAHLDAEAANRQCDRAFERMMRCQDPDGAWGASEREWSTFLAVHALRNKSVI